MMKTKRSFPETWDSEMPFLVGSVFIADCDVHMAQDADKVTWPEYYNGHNLIIEKGNTVLVLDRLGSTLRIMTSSGKYGWLSEFALATFFEFVI